MLSIVSSSSLFTLHSSLLYVYPVGFHPATIGIGVGLGTDISKLRTYPLALLHLELRYEMGRDYQEEDKATVEKLAANIMKHYREGEGQDYVAFRTVSKYMLTGVGAPTGIFIGDTAALLETKSRVSEFSKVANAIGAAAGDIITEYTAVIQMSKKGDYYLTGGDVMGVYGSYDRALEDAKELARSKAEERARMQTPEGDLKTEFDVREDFFRLPAGDKVLVKTEVTASVRIII